MNCLKINIDHLKENSEIKNSIESYVCKDISDTIKEQNLRIDYTIKLFENDILISGLIFGKLVLECSRCLENFTFPVNIKINQSFQLQSKEIDFSDEIRQLLILNIPAKPLCSDRCQGICPICGSNKNSKQCGCKVEKFDHRLEKLKDLLK